MKVVLCKGIKHGLIIKLWSGHFYVCPHFEKQGDKNQTHYVFGWLTIAVLIKILSKKVSKK